MSRREQIKMSEAEVASFLAQERTVTCATIGPRGWPHTMPLWYVLRQAPAGEPGPRLWAWTYGASQKALNLERDPRATLQVEAGERYDELRGVTLECDVVVHRDVETVRELGMEIFRRYAFPRAKPASEHGASPHGAEPVEELAPEVESMVAAQALKRVALEFRERRRASWDHRKLGGVY